jgi:hypothetical protein
MISYVLTPDKHKTFIRSILIKNKYFRSHFQDKVQLYFYLNFITDYIVDTFDFVGWIKIKSYYFERNKETEIEDKNISDYKFLVWFISKYIYIHMIKLNKDYDNKEFIKNDTSDMVLIID